MFLILLLFPRNLGTDMDLNVQIYIPKPTTQWF